MQQLPDGTFSRGDAFGTPIPPEEETKSADGHNKAQKGPDFHIGAQNASAPASMAETGADVKHAGNDPSLMKITDFAGQVLTPNQKRAVEFLQHSMKTTEEARKFLENQPNKTFVLIQNHDGLQMVVKMHTNVFIINNLELKNDRILITTKEGHQLSYKTWDKLALDMDFKGYNFKEATIQATPLVSHKEIDPLKAKAEQYMPPAGISADEARDLLKHQNFHFFIMHPEKENKPYKLIINQQNNIYEHELIIKEGLIYIGPEGNRRCYGSFEGAFEAFDLQLMKFSKNEDYKLGQEDIRSTIQFCFDRGKLKPQLISFLETENIELDHYTMENCKYFEVAQDPSKELDKFFLPDSPNKNKTAIVFDKSKNQFMVAVPTFREDPMYKCSAPLNAESSVEDTLLIVRRNIINLRRQYMDNHVQEILLTMGQNAKLEYFMPESLELGILYVIPNSMEDELTFAYVDPYTLLTERETINPVKVNSWRVADDFKDKLQKAEIKQKEFFEKIGINEKTNYPIIISENIKISRNLSNPNRFDLEFPDFEGTTEVMSDLSPQSLKRAIVYAQRRKILMKIGSGPSILCYNPVIDFSPRQIENRFRANPQLETLIVPNETLSKFTLTQYDPKTGNLFCKIINEKDISTLEAVLKREIDKLSESKKELNLFRSIHYEFEFFGNLTKHNVCDPSYPKAISLNQEGTSFVLQLYYEPSGQVFSTTVSADVTATPLHIRLEQALAALQSEVDRYEKNFNAFVEFKKTHADEFEFYREFESVQALGGSMGIKIQKDGFNIYQADPKTQDLLMVKISSLDELKEATLALQEKIVIAHSYKITDELMRKPAPSTKIEIPPIPETDTPENDLHSLLQIFDEINFTKPDEPNYIDPKSLTNDGSPTTKKAMREGLIKLIDFVENRKDHSGVPNSKVRRELYYDMLEALLRNSAMKLNQRRAGVLNGEENKSAMKAIQQNVLILAEAGSHCGGRWQSEAIQLYTSLSDQWETMLRQWGLRTQVHVMSDQLKLGTIEKIIYEIVDPNEDTAHAYTRLQNILLKDGIPTPNAEASDFGDPYVAIGTRKFLSPELLSMFKARFNSSQVLEFIMGKLNERLKNPATQDRVLNELRKQVSTDSEVMAALGRIKLDLGTRSDVDYQKEKENLERLQKEENDKALDMDLLNDIQNAKRADLMLGKPLRKRFNALAEEQPTHMKEYIDQLPEDKKRIFIQMGLYGSFTSFEKRIDELSALYEQEKANVLDKFLDAKGLLKITSNEVDLTETKGITQKGTLALLQAMGFFRAKAKAY